LDGDCDGDGGLLLWGGGVGSSPASAGSSCTLASSGGLGGGLAGPLLEAGPPESDMASRSISCVERAVLAKSGGSGGGSLYCGEIAPAPSLSGNRAAGARRLWGRGDNRANSTGYLAASERAQSPATSYGGGWSMGEGAADSGSVIPPAPTGGGIIAGGIMDCIIGGGCIAPDACIIGGCIIIGGGILGGGIIGRCVDPSYKPGGIHAVLRGT